MMASEKEAALAAGAFALTEAPTMKEIPSTSVYEDDKVYAFRDISPQAPVHILIIPKVRWIDRAIQGIELAHWMFSELNFSQFNSPKDLVIDALEERHCEILGYLLYIAKVIAKQEGLEDGFRIVINDGPSGCQSVYHLHVHLLRGRQMNWPPG